MKGGLFLSEELRRKNPLEIKKKEKGKKVGLTFLIGEKERGLSSKGVKGESRKCEEWLCFWGVMAAGEERTMGALHLGEEDVRSIDSSSSPSSRRRVRWQVRMMKEKCKPRKEKSQKSNFFCESQKPLCLQIVDSLSLFFFSLALSLFFNPFPLIKK